MADYNFLLGAQVPQAPNPLQLAGQGLTLGNLATGLQSRQLELAMQQQMAQALPEFYAQLQGGGQGGGQPGPNGEPQQPQDINSVLANMVQKYPLAGQQLTNMVLGMQEKQAEINAKLGSAAKDRQQTLDLQLQNMQRWVAGANPPPQLVASELMRLNQDPSRFFDPNNPGSFNQNVANGLQDPKVRAEMAGTAATTAKTLLETAQAPAKLAVEQSQAASSASQAATAAKNQQRQQWEFMGGNVVRDTATNNYYQMARDPNDPTKVTPVPIIAGGAGAQPTAPPAGGAAPPNATSAAPPTSGGPQPTNAPGTQFQTGFTPGAEALMQESGKTAATLASAIPAAYEGLNSVARMRNAINTGQGIFSGPVKGSDFFINMMGILSQMPGMSDAMREKVGNTQAWNSEGGELAFNMLNSLKGSAPRAQAALTQIRGIKANTIMTTQAQLEVLDAIEQRFNDQIQFAKSASSTVQGGGTISQTPLPAGMRGPANVTRNADGSWNFNLNQ
jgi:hypothetical protein